MNEIQYTGQSELVPSFRAVASHRVQQGPQFSLVFWELGPWGKAAGAM